MKPTFLFAMMLVTGSVLAGDGLSATKVKDLMIDKTIEGHNEIKDLDYTVYFSTDGKVNFVTAKGKRVGNWRIAEDGHFCTAFPSEPELCTLIIPHGDSAYRRVKDDGTPTHTLKKFTAGNINNY